MLSLLFLKGNCNGGRGLQEPQKSLSILCQRSMPRVNHVQVSPQVLGWKDPGNHHN
jgi:hypothetical protein